MLKLLGSQQNSNQSNLDNLRPISLLPIPAKTLDKMILERMRKIAYDKKIISENSFGFNRGKSINEMFVQLLQQIEENKKSKTRSIIIKLDIYIRILIL